MKFPIFGFLITYLFLICLNIPAASGSAPPVDLTGAQLLEKYSNGTKKYLLKDGSEAVIFSDGSTKVTRKDGMVIQTWPGKKEIKRITYPDGTVESFFYDGSRRVAQKDGSQVMTWPDGRRREVHTDGTVWISSTAKRILINRDIIVLEKYPDRVNAGVSYIYKFKLKRGYSDPWACVLCPNGVIRIILGDNIKRDAKGVYSLKIKFDGGNGRYKVEIILVGRYGNEIAANFPVWVSVAKPKAEKIKMCLVADPRTPLEVLEQRFWKMVNKTRNVNNVSELPWNPEVHQIARNHARDMSQNGFFGHISPTHGNLARRAIKLFGWQTTFWGVPSGPPEAGKPNYIAEDLNRTHSLTDALDNLMESPAHRRLLLCPFFTSGGIGMSWSEHKNEKMLYIVTAMLQKNRPTASTKRKPRPKPKPPPPPDDDFHIYGRDED